MYEFALTTGKRKTKNGNENIESEKRQQVSATQHTQGNKGVVSRVENPWGSDEGKIGIRQKCCATEPSP